MVCDHPAIFFLLRVMVLVRSVLNVSAHSLADSGGSDDDSFHSELFTHTSIPPQLSHSFTERKSRGLVLLILNYRWSLLPVHLNGDPLDDHCGKYGTSEVDNNVGSHLKQSSRRLLHPTSATQALTYGSEFRTVCGTPPVKQSRSPAPRLRIRVIP